MPYSSSPTMSSPRRRALSEARSLETRWTLLERQDRELLLCNWMLERNQLKAENKQLTRQLEDANTKISSLRKKLLHTSQRGDNGDDESVSSHDATVKAGSSRLAKSKKRYMFPKLLLCCDGGRMKENSMHKDNKVTVKSMVGESKRTRMKEGRKRAITWEEPSSASFSKASRYPRLQLNSSFDSTEASSRASLAEF